MIEKGVISHLHSIKLDKQRRGWGSLNNNRDKIINNTEYFKDEDRKSQKEEPIAKMYYDLSFIKLIKIFFLIIN